MNSRYPPGRTQDAKAVKRADYAALGNAVPRVTRPCGAESAGCYAARPPLSGSAYSLVLSLRRLNYCSPDDFDDLRDDRVPEASQTVHPSGNPMSHSTHVGFNAPPAAALSGKLFR